jgi:lysophospholipase L1-like esterase
MTLGTEVPSRDAERLGQNRSMLRRTLLRRTFCKTLIAVLAFVTAGLLPAADRSESAKWHRAIEAFEAADKRSPPAPGAVLFVGSSSIRFWKTLPADFPQDHVLNRGFGGSHIADCTAFADRIVIPYRPSVIILHAGANDLAAGKSPQQVFADYKAFVAKVREALPETPIAFLAINPTPARWAQAARQQETNRLIREHAAGKQGLAFIDLWDALLGPDGQPRADLHVRDRLHPNAAGYKIRTRLVTAYLASLKLPTHTPTP